MLCRGIGQVNLLNRGQNGPQGPERSGHTLITWTDSAHQTIINRLALIRGAAAQVRVQVHG